MIKNKLEKILKDKFNLNNNEIKLNFFKDHILDSFSFLELVSEIEKNFKIKIDLKKISFEDFKNMSSIIKYIKKNEKR